MAGMPKYFLLQLDAKALPHPQPNFEKDGDTKTGLLISY